MGEGQGAGGHKAVGENALCHFISTFVSKLYGVNSIRTWIKANKGKNFLDMMTINDVAYCISLVRNSGAVWSHDHAMCYATPEEQDKYVNWATLVSEDDRDKYKPPTPLFSGGKGIKRTFCGVMWNNEGLKFLKDTEKAWKDARLDKEGEWTDMHNMWDRFVRSHTSCERVAVHWKKRKRKQNNDSTEEEEEELEGATSTAGVELFTRDEYTEDSDDKDDDDNARSEDGRENGGDGKDDDANARSEDGRENGTGGLSVDKSMYGMGGDDDSGYSDDNSEENSRNNGDDGSYDDENVNNNSVNDNAESMEENEEENWTNKLVDKKVYEKDLEVSSSDRSSEDGSSSEEEDENEREDDDESLDEPENARGGLMKKKC